MICIRVNCGKEITGSGKKFCSLSCSSTHNAKRGRRKDYTRVCLRDDCENTFEAVGGTRKKKFCSRSCSAKTNNLLRNTQILCRRCSLPCGTGKTWCSVECRKKYPVEQWLAGELSACNKYAVAGWAREYVLEQAGYRCEGLDSRTGERCTEDRVHPRTKKTILQLDHIDGNWQNCERENLRVLCPTCHVLTPTWGAGNMGRGRTWKAGYSQYEAKS